MKLVFKKLNAILKKYLVKDLLIIISVPVIIFMLSSFASKYSKLEPDPPQKKKYVFAFPEEDFPPFDFRDKQQHRGITIDLLNAMSQLLNIDYEIKFVPFKDIVSMITNEKVDATLVSTHYSMREEKILDFSNTYYTNSISMMSLNRQEQNHIMRKKIVNIEELKKNDIVGVIRGSFSAKVIRDKITPFDIQYFPDVTSSINALMDKRVDYLLVDHIILWYYIYLERVRKPHSEKLHSHYFEFKPTNLPKIQYQLAVKKDENKLLILLFNNLLERLKQNGSYKRILYKYLSPKKMKTITTVLNTKNNENEKESSKAIKKNKEQNHHTLLYE